MKEDIKEAKILNNSLKKAKTFDRKDWRKNKKAGSDKKLAGLISFLEGKVNDIDTYILKVGLAGYKNPQMILNFPQRDCLRTRKLTIDY